MTTNPTTAWVRTKLRNNPTHPVRRKIIAAYIIGSHAKGTATTTSDLDIAVIIPRVHNKTSLQVTAQYHNYFTDDRQRPTWCGCLVDFQFFYADDPVLAGYTMVALG